MERNNSLAGLIDKNEKDSMALNTASCLTLPELHYIKAATAQNTRKAYQQDVRHFIQWGGTLPTTSDKIIQYLQQHAAILNPRTLERRMSGIRQWHLAQSLPDPTNYMLVKKILKGIKNIHGKPKNKAPALTIEKLTLVVEKLRLGETLADIRDNALFQLHFFGAFRRSEIAAIRCEDISFQVEGIQIRLNRSKTDQTGEGHLIAIPYIKSDQNPNPKLCPVTALKKWLSVSNLQNGPLFCAIDKGGDIKKTSLHGFSISSIIKKRSKQFLGQDSIYTSHSLRSGFATSAAKANVPLADTMKQARWLKAETALGYCEAGKSFQENPALKILKAIKT